MGAAQKIVITLVRDDGTEEKINSNSIKDFTITKKLNDHVRFYFSGGRISVNQKEDFLYRTNLETRIKVEYISENFETLLIFTGVVTRIKLEYLLGENYYYMKVNGASISHLLGLVSCRRSFQNRELPYQKLFDQIATVNGAVISAGKELMEKNSKDSKQLGQFTLQYQETNWKFLKRLASRFQTGLVPDPVATKPSLTVGLPEGKEYAIEQPHILGIKKRIDKHRVIEANYDKSSIPEEYVYYKLRTNQFLNIGDIVKLPATQPNLYVYIATAYILGSEVYFEAVVTPYGGLRQKPRFNQRLAGLTLEGYVIEVGGADDDPLKDKVKLRINGDDPTSPEEAAWFSYTTYYSSENHTGFYCLPELNDYVKMYFPSTNEEEAIIVSSRRLERDREKLVDHLNTKMFRTNDQKELALTQTGVTLSGKAANLQIQLDQDKGVIVSSHNELEIRSKGNLNLQAGKKMLISAKKMINIKCGQKSQVVLNENEKSGMVHVFGGQVKKEEGKMAGGKSNYSGVSNIPLGEVTCKREIIEWGAKKLGVDPNFMGGVILSESGGGGFLNDKLIIRFEAHYFNNFTSSKYKDHFSYNQQKNWLDQKYREDVNSNNWEWIHPGKKQQSQEHKVFNFAKGLDEDAAYKSISMGLGQIMGNNYKAAGYNSAKEMYEDFCKGEAQQIKGIINFISSKKSLNVALKNSDFTTFVKGYNGPGQVENYKEKFKKNIEVYKEPNCKLCKPCKKKH